MMFLHQLIFAVFGYIRDNHDIVWMSMVDEVFLAWAASCDRKLNRHALWGFFNKIKDRYQGTWCEWDLPMMWSLICSRRLLVEMDVIVFGRCWWRGEMQDEKETKVRMSLPLLFSPHNFFLGKETPPPTQSDALIFWASQPLPSPHWAWRAEVLTLSLSKRRTQFCGNGCD